MQVACGEHVHDSNIAQRKDAGNVVMLMCEIEFEKKRVVGRSFLRVHFASSCEQREIVVA